MSIPSDDWAPDWAPPAYRGHLGRLAHANPIARTHRTSIAGGWPQLATCARLPGGCHQDGRLIVSAPGELRLGANLSVLAISKPNPGGRGASSYHRPLTRGDLSEPQSSSPACER
jgi:hypothetical protein